MLKKISLRQALGTTIIAALALSSSMVYAGGIALGATRIIYPAGSHQESLSITNSDKDKRFLIQSWVEDENGKKTSDFTITPHLFASKPLRENTIRIIYTGKQLPDDRESLYWLNSKAIPAVDSDSIKDKNVLQIAIVSRIKLFVRPAGLTVSPGEAQKNLQFRRNGSSLVIENSSPYYITLVNFKTGTKTLPSTMVSPKGHATVNLPADAAGNVSWQTVSDYGSNTPVSSALMK